MLVEVCNRCSDFDSYRAARVKSLFNAESGANFALDAELPIEEDDWRIGIIVGPSGGGNSLLGRLVFGDEHVYREPEWPEDAPIIDAIAPGKDSNDVTAALAAVGLGDVPAWLPPYPVLSNGEGSARCSAASSPMPPSAWSSTSSPRWSTARSRSSALSPSRKAWRRTNGKAVLLTPHFDVLEWVEPDWTFDSATGTFDRRRLQRPGFDLQVWETD